MALICMRWFVENDPYAPTLEMAFGFTAAAGIHFFSLFNTTFSVILFLIYYLLVSSMVMYVVTKLYFHLYNICFNCYTDR